MPWPLMAWRRRLLFEQGAGRPGAQADEHAMRHCHGRKQGVDGKTYPVGPDRRCGVLQSGRVVPFARQGGGHGAGDDDRSGRPVHHARHHAGAIGPGGISLHGLFAY